jgi:hypothetical protein
MRPPPVAEAVSHADLLAQSPGCLDAIERVRGRGRVAAKRTRMHSPLARAVTPASPPPSSLIPSPKPSHSTNPQAYGPGGLGILLVTDVPDLAALRSALLPCAHALATRLSPPAVARLEDAASTWNVGWSHGREAVSATGKADTRKGSFYANPLTDEPGKGEPAALQAFPGLARPNVWPSPGRGDEAEDDLAARLRPAFRAAGAAMASVGRAVADAADAVLARQGCAPRPTLASALACGRGAKGRLLFYYPKDEAEAEEEEEEEEEEDGWCGWHVDHSLLTVLCPAAFLDGPTGAEVACPDARAGLWVRPRRRPASAAAAAAAQAGTSAPPPPPPPAVRVAIPPGALAVQVGEAAQVLAGGRLEATPHCVRAAAAGGAPGVGRASFALFLQPWVDCPLAPPSEEGVEAVGVPRWRPGDTFGAFSERTVAAYY